MSYLRLEVHFERTTFSQSILGKSVLSYELLGIEIPMFLSQLFLVEPFITFKLLIELNIPILTLTLIQKEIILLQGSQLNIHYYKYDKGRENYYSCKIVSDNFKRRAGCS